MIIINASDIIFYDPEQKKKISGKGSNICTKTGLNVKTINGIMSSLAELVRKLHPFCSRLGSLIKIALITALLFSPMRRRCCRRRRCDTFL